MLTRFTWKWWAKGQDFSAGYGAANKSFIGQGLEQFNLKERFLPELTFCMNFLDAWAHG